MQRAELININTTNTNLIQQLRMVTSYPFGIPDELREGTVRAAQDVLQGDFDPKVKMFAAKLVAELMKVNVSLLRAVATDQVQRHVSFDKHDEVQANKFAQLETMTDEELDALESLSKKAGGVLPVKDA